MNIEQKKFERIVADAASLLNSSHAHLMTVADGGEPAPFRMDLTSLAAAICEALSRSGISIGAEANADSALCFLQQHQDQLGVTVERSGDAINIKRVGPTPVSGPQIDEAWLLRQAG